MTRDSEERANASYADEKLLDPDSSEFWRESDLAAICRHQLSAAVQVELVGIDPSIASKLPALCGARDLLLRSFGDLLTHPHPPLELLQITRRFAKMMLTHPRSPLPRQVAGAIYYASIVAALLRCHTRISKLSDRDLRQGLESHLAFPWLEDPLRSLFGEGLATLAASERAPP